MQTQTTVQQLPERVGNPDPTAAAYKTIFDILMECGTSPVQAMNVIENIMADFETRPRYLV